MWTGCTTAGYGRFAIAHQSVPAQRFAWELVIGPIPRGMELGHRNACPHHCVNPDHWALATDQQNAIYSAAHPSPTDRRWRTTQRLCVIDGCDHKHVARGVCAKHVDQRVELVHATHRRRVRRRDFRHRAGGEGREEMTIISTVAVTAHQGTDPKKLLEHLAKGVARIKSYEGVQDVTLAAIAAGGAATNSMVVMATCEDWTTYGKIQQELNTDQEMIQLLLDAGQLATWQTYVSQTIDFSLLPS